VLAAAPQLQLWGYLCEALAMLVGTFFFLGAVSERTAAFYLPEEERKKTPYGSFPRKIIACPMSFNDGGQELATSPPIGIDGYETEMFFSPATT